MFFLRPVGRYARSTRATSWPKGDTFFPWKNPPTWHPSIHCSSCEVGLSYLIYKKHQFEKKGGYFFMVHANVGPFGFLNWAWHAPSSQAKTRALYTWHTHTEREQNPLVYEKLMLYKWATFDLSPMWLHRRPWRRRLTVKGLYTSLVVSVFTEQPSALTYADW